MSTSDLLSIGRFARLTGLTVKALRHYGELGLLQPAHVDDQTGYRFYGRAQVADALAIRRLRLLELPLHEVRAALAGGPGELREQLVAHRARMEQRAAGVGRVLDELTRLIDGKEKLVPDPTDILYEVAVKEFADQPVLSIRERAPTEELKHVIPAAYKELFAYLAEIGAEAVEPWTITVCPFADPDGIVDIENTVLVAEPLPGRGRIESRTLPGCTAVCLTHRGPYEELSRSYNALSQWVEEQGLETAGAPREIYLTDPEETPDPADYVTELAWPIVPDPTKLARIEAGAGEISTKPLLR